VLLDESRGEDTDQEERQRLQDDADEDDSELVEPSR